MAALGDQILDELGSRGFVPSRVVLIETMRMHAHTAMIKNGAVQTFSGRQINFGLDSTIEMSAEDAPYLIQAGCTKLKPGVA